MTFTAFGATVELAPPFFFPPLIPYFRPTLLGVTLQVTLNILVGLTFALAGSFLMVSCKRMSKKRAWANAGAVYLGAGTLVLTAALYCIAVLAGRVELARVDSLEVTFGVFVSTLGTIMTAIAAVLGARAFSRS